MDQDKESRGAARAAAVDLENPIAVLEAVRMRERNNIPYRPLGDIPEEVLDAPGLSLARGWGRSPTAIIRTEAHAGWTKGWLARLVFDANDAHLFIRQFVTGEKDLSRRGNGYVDYQLDVLEDGFYEAESVYRSGRHARYIIQIEDHRVVGIKASDELHTAKVFVNRHHVLWRAKDMGRIALILACESAEDLVALMEELERREKAKVAVEAMISAEAKELPELDGSEKQRKWARDIRHRRLASLKERIEDLDEEDEDELIIINSLRAAMAWLSKKTKSRWWIDHRNGLSASEICDMAAELDLDVRAGRLLPILGRF